MAWFALVVAVLAVAHFAIAHPGLRSVLKWTGLGVLGLTAVAIAAGTHTDRLDRQQRQAARTLIRPSQVEISDATLKLNERRGSDLTAIVTNKSAYRITRLELRAKITHCPPSGACRVVGDQVVSDSTDIPSGQSRAFSGYVTFRNLPPLRDGDWSSSYTIATIEAERG